MLVDGAVITRVNHYSLFGRTDYEAVGACQSGRIYKNSLKLIEPNHLLGL
jgi:hypothetical protein